MRATATAPVSRPVPPLTIELDSYEAVVLFTVLAGGSSDRDEAAFVRGADPEGLPLVKDLFARLGTTPTSGQGANVMARLFKALESVLK